MTFFKGIIGLSLWELFEIMDSDKLYSKVKPNIMAIGFSILALLVIIVVGIWAKLTYDYVAYDMRRDAAEEEIALRKETALIEYNAIKDQHSKHILILEKDSKEKTLALEDLKSSISQKEAYIKTLAEKTQIIQDLDLQISEKRISLNTLFSEFNDTNAKKLGNEEMLKAMDSEKEALQTELSSLESKVSTLNLEYKKLDGDKILIEKSKQEKTRLIAEVSAFESKLASLDKQLSDSENSKQLSSTISSKRNELTQLVAEIEKSKQDSLTGFEQNKKQQSQNSSLEVHNAKIAKDLEQNKSLLNDTKEALDNAKLDIIKCETTLATSNTLISENKKTLASLDVEISEKEKKLREANNELLLLNKKLGEVSSTNNALSAENLSLRDDVKEQKAISQSLNSQNNDLSLQNKVLDKSVLEKQAYVKNLEDKITELNKLKKSQDENQEKGLE